MSTTINWSTMTDRERDAFIAEHVFGHQIHAGLEQGSETEPDYYFTDPVDNHLRSVPCYSTDLRWSWHVAEQFDEPTLSTHTLGKYRCLLKKPYLVAIGVADTPSKAICLAALRLKGFEVKE